MSRNEKNENKQQNNTLPCEVVKEILPLYHDGIVSKQDAFIKEIQAQAADASDWDTLEGDGKEW